MRKPCAVGLGVACLLTGAVFAIAPVGASTSTFTGTVSASGTRWRTYSFGVTAPAAVTATLQWTVTSANLDLFLKNPAGTIVATAATSARPESISYQATVSGTWKILVKATTGAASFKLSVGVQPSSGSAPLAHDDWLFAVPDTAASRAVLANDSGTNLHLGSLAAPLH